MIGDLQKLSSQGYRITPQRRIILEVLKEANRHLSAEEIIEEVRQRQPSVSPATIYRNLNLLVEANVLARLDLHTGPARFEINQGHNHHMVCLNCGCAIKIGVCPMQGEITRVIDESGFKVDTHHFEIMGYCKECQAKQEKTGGWSKNL